MPVGQVRASFTNMLVLKLVSLALVLAVAHQTNGLKWQKDVPILVKTLKDLQRGPPKQMVTNRANVAEKWITQPIDHFDESNKATYQMVSNDKSIELWNKVIHVNVYLKRYLVNDEFQTEGSPIFIFLGGEWEAEPGMISKGHWYDMAKEHKGLLIYTEHRYYGKSVPTK